MIMHSIRIMHAHLNLYGRTVWKWLHISELTKLVFLVHIHVYMIAVTDTHTDVQYMYMYMSQFKHFVHVYIHVYIHVWLCVTSTDLSFLYSYYRPLPFCYFCPQFG